MKRKVCKSHLCESCMHLFEEQGKQFQSCDFDFLSSTNYEDIELVCSSCGTYIGMCDEVKNLKRTQATLVKSALQNPKVTVVGYTAPSVRASISEMFGEGEVEDAQGKVVAALRLLGFDVVFDMNVAADFTVVEEAHEFVKRLKENKNLPMMTSCCPGWVNYVTKFWKEFIPNLSTCKSPQQMFGALINNYFSKSIGKKSTDLFVVSIVPCVAKKLEAKQAGINSNVGFDVDAAITTTELVEMIQKAKINFDLLEPSNFDTFFGSASGAGTIFGNTGGVMEAVLRTAGDSIDQTDVDASMFELVRGQEGIRRRTIKLGGRDINIAVVSGIMNAKDLLENIRLGKENLHFIEVMACPGGCVGGGGQPRHDVDKIPEYVKKRAKVLYDSELQLNTKKAHRNPAVLKIYEDYIGDIGGEESINLLHRYYDNFGE